MDVPDSIWGPHKTTGSGDRGQVPGDRQDTPSLDVNDGPDEGHGDPSELDARWRPPADQGAPFPEYPQAGGEPSLPTEQIRYPGPSEPGALPAWEPTGATAGVIPGTLEADTLEALVISPPQTDPAPARRISGFGGVLLGLALAAVVALASFGLGRLVASDGSSTSTTSAVATQISAPTTTLVPTTDPPPPVSVLPPAPVNGVEPVAAAAAAVAPAVVQIETSGGTGSGVVYDADGYILTAAHVVGTASNVTVRLADGARITGEVVGADGVTDVAVVSIDADSVPAVARLAVGVKLSVGQTAVAVGSPFRLDQTVTAGIVSSVDRIVSNISMVQTDAAINPGNSGGPLVDSTGAVIGINDVIFTNSGGNEGVGFAISIDIAKIVADQITAGETVSLAYLGVGVDVPATGEAGALIQNVEPDTAAESAGLQVGDLVVAIDGDPVRDSEDLRAEIITREPGSGVTLTVIREDSRITLEARLGTIATN